MAADWARARPCVTVRVFARRVGHTARRQAWRIGDLDLADSDRGSVSRTKTRYIAHVKLTDADVMRSEAAKEVLRLYM